MSLLENGHLDLSGKNVKKNNAKHTLCIIRNHECKTFA